jgi:hypothetical protein
VKLHPVERLRRVWTPGREIEELVHRLDPRTELDSAIRHILHAVVQQHGPQRISLGSELQPLENVGSLRWEIIHGPGPDEIRQRELTIWIE